MASTKARLLMHDFPVHGTRGPISPGPLIKNEKSAQRESFWDGHPADIRALKALTSLNKEVRPFFLGDNSIWRFPSVSSLSDYSIGGLEGCFSLAVIAFGAFEYIVPKYYRLGEMEFKESSLLI